MGIAFPQPPLPPMSPQTELIQSKDPCGTVKTSPYFALPASSSLIGFGAQAVNLRSTPIQELCVSCRASRRLCVTRNRPWWASRRVFHFPDETLFLPSRAAMEAGGITPCPTFSFLVKSTRELRAALRQLWRNIISAAERNSNKPSLTQEHMHDLFKSTNRWHFGWFVISPPSGQKVVLLIPDLSSSVWGKKGDYSNVYLLTGYYYRY